MWYDKIMKNIIFTLMIGLGLTGCYEPDKEWTLGVTNRLRPHDCTLKTDEAHAEMVMEEASKWAAVGCFQVSVEVVERPGKERHDVTFTGQSGDPENDLNGSVQVYENDINYLRTERGLDADVRRTLLHELGHHFGLKHSQDPDSVMTESLNKVWEPQDGDIAEMKELCEKYGLVRTP